MEIRWRERSTGRGAYHALQYRSGGEWYALRLQNSTHTHREDGWECYSHPVEGWETSQVLRVLHRTNTWAESWHGPDEPCQDCPVRAVCVE